MAHHEVCPVTSTATIDGRPRILICCKVKGHRLPHRSHDHCTWWGERQTAMRPLDDNEYEDIHFTEDEAQEDAMTTHPPMVARRCEAHPYFSAQWCKRGAGHLDGAHVTSITGLHYAWTSPYDGWYLDDGAEVCAEVAHGARGIVACWLPIGHEQGHAGRSADHTFHTWPAIDPSEREPLTVATTTEWDSIDDEAVEKVAESMQIPEHHIVTPPTLSGLRRNIEENPVDEIPTVDAQPAKIEYLDSEREPFVRVVAYVETHHGEISRVERTAFLDEADDPDGIEVGKDLQAHVSRILYRGI